MKKIEAFAGAYLVRGPVEALDALLTQLSSSGLIGKASPDLFARAYRSFGVEDAADVRARARTKPVQDTRRVFVLAASAMSTESQNALLKLLEEPVADAVFFLLVPSPEMLHSTVRSRTRSFELNEYHDASSVDAGDFLDAPTAKRLEMLKPLYEHDDDGRDLGGVIAFLGSLERRFASGARTSENIAGLHAIYRARKYAGDRGSLLKALLEQVALLAPKV